MVNVLSDSVLIIDEEEITSTQASKKQKTDKICSKRIRTEPQRYGIEENETNDDVLFEEILSKSLTASNCSDTSNQNQQDIESVYEKSTDSAKDTEKNNNQLAVLSPGEKILFEKITDLSK